MNKEFILIGLIIFLFLDLFVMIRGFYIGWVCINASTAIHRYIMSCNHYNKHIFENIRNDYHTMFWSIWRWDKYLGVKDIYRDILVNYFD